MKVAFIIGHNPYSKGAFSNYFNDFEFDFWSSFSSNLESFGDVFIHDNKLGYTSRQKEMAKKTRDYDLVFELHFNAANKLAHGCEALYYYANEKSRKLCESFCSDFTQRTGIKNRGAKRLVDKTERGFGFVYYQKPAAVILEPFFGDNEVDCSLFSIDDFVKSLKKVINDFK